MVGMATSMWPRATGRAGPRRSLEFSRAAPKIGAARDLSASLLPFKVDDFCGVAYKYCYVSRNVSFYFLAMYAVLYSMTRWPTFSYSVQTLRG